MNEKAEHVQPVAEDITEEGYPPLSGIIYGKCTAAMALLGMVVSLTGLIWYLSGSSSILPPQQVLSSMLAGKSVDEIWLSISGNTRLEGHWYLSNLKASDGFALAGIALTCLGAIVGMWGAAGAKIYCAHARHRPLYKMYVVLLVVMALLLMLNASGVIR